jgi:hypothetical protein
MTAVISEGSAIQFALEDGSSSGWENVINLM